MSTPGVPLDVAALSSGASIPLLGFGTWQLTGSAAQAATEAALAAGYRHLDTATMYGNEREIGAALRGSGLAGDDVFVTTKLPPDQASQARATLEQSLELLGIDALDLWLIHWPPADSVATWRDLIAARDAGLVRDIGVSNFSLSELDGLKEATGELPALNQIRWSPLLFDAAIADGHAARGVVLEGYSGLKGGTLDDPTITGIASRLGRTPAKVIIRWHLQHGFVVIPKSASPDRIRANAEVADFELTPEDMSALDAARSSVHAGL